MTELAPILLVSITISQEDRVMLVVKQSCSQTVNLKMDKFNTIKHSFARGREMH